MQKARAALRLLNVSDGWHRVPRCRRRAAAAGFSSTVSDHLPLPLPASSMEDPCESQQKLNRLENIVEQHGCSLASLASRLEEQKQIVATILDGIELLKASHAKPDLRSLDVSASSSSTAPPWPEWTSFLQHLKGLPFFKGSKEVAEFGDPTTVKRTITKFSQAYEHIFDSLSVTHLRVLAEYGCPNDDRRAVASRNRLQNVFQIEEKSNSCDSKPANPKLSDVMRLIYTIAEVARKDGTPDVVKLSISHLLEEIISTTSNCKHQKIVYPETLKDSGSVLKNSLMEKSLMAEVKTGSVMVEAKTSSSSSCDAKILSQHDKWKCPRCSCMNWQSKSKCMECSFQPIERSALDIDSMMLKSSTLSTNRFDTKVCVSGEENKQKTVSAPKKGMEIPDVANDRQAVITEKLLEQGLANVPIAVQEQGGLQKCTLSKEVEKNLGRAGFIVVSDTDEHSDIFDDIFDSNDTSKKKQNNLKECSLSDLVRQNKKAFSSSKKERGAATGADEYERKGERPFNGKGYKPDDLDFSIGRMSYRAEPVDSFIEVEDRGMLPHRSGGGQVSASSSMGGKRSSGRTFGDGRPRSEYRQHYNRERYSDAESGRYSSAKIYGNEGPKHKESKAQGGYSGKSEGGDSKAERGGGFEGKGRNKGRLRY